MGAINLFYIIPAILVGGVILAIISALIGKKEFAKKILYIGVICILVVTFFLMAIVVPYAFLSLFLEGFSGILLVGITIYVVCLVISTAIQAKNQKIISSNNEKEIYIRDIEVEYSPAVLSYLVNNKIETKKDLSATLLNLCVNNVLKIDKNENGKITIIDLKNTEKVEKLSEDEKYAYQMLTSKVTNSKIRVWKQKIYEEYKKYRFSKENKKDLSKIILYLYIAIFIIIFIYTLMKPLFNVERTILDTVLGIMIFVTFFAAWEYPFLIIMRVVLIGGDEKTKFIDTYTKKGAIEYNRWKKFQKFIEDYTFVKEKDFESIAILGKYLSYSIALGINKKSNDELYKEIDINYSFDYEKFLSIFGDKDINKNINIKENLS